MIIYVDALFIEEFLINFLILFITTKITNTKFTAERTDALGSPSEKVIILVSVP